MNDSTTNIKKHHSPFIIAQTLKSPEKTYLYHFKSKLLFENLMHISPQDIEEALNIIDPNLKLPSFLELLDLKIRIQTEEQKLKDILPYGLHSGQAWVISKYLSFLYLICANIFLTRNIYQKFSLFYMKALHVIEPPTKDCDWETKSEWQILRIIAGTHLSLFYCKNEKLAKSIEILQNLKNLLNNLEQYPPASKILYHIYASLGLLFYRMNEFIHTRKYLEKGIIYLEKFINKTKPKRPNDDKELNDIYEEEMRGLEYCKLINLYLNYKNCKISFHLKDRQASFQSLNKALYLLEVYKYKLYYVEHRDYIIQYIQTKLRNVQRELQIDIRKGLLQDLNEEMKENSESTISEILIDEKVEPIRESINNNPWKIEEPKKNKEISYKNENEQKEKGDNQKEQKEALLYRIRRTKSNQIAANKALGEQVIRKEEVKELEKVRKVKSSQIKSAYKQYDFRQGGHIKAQSSNFTMFQKPQEKIPKIYELLGRPVFVKRKASKSNSKGNSISTSISATSLSHHKENVKNMKTYSDVWKKIQDFTAEQEINNMARTTSGNKTTKEIKEIIELKQKESDGLTNLNQNYNNEKLGTLTANLFNVKINNFKRKNLPPVDPLITELIGDLKDMNESMNFESKIIEKKMMKKDELIADEIINDFFNKIEGKSQRMEKQNIDSLNTVKSDGELDEEHSFHNTPLKDSHKFEKSSSKLRNNNDLDKQMMPPTRDQFSTTHLKNTYKFEVANNEKTQKAALFIQKRFRAFMKSKAKKQDNVPSPETKNPSPSFQRVFKKYHTLTNIHLNQAFVSKKNEPPERFSEVKEPLEKRHKSYIFNLKDMLIKRRQIKIIINQDYLKFLSQKITQKPQIKVSSNNNQESLYFTPDVQKVNSQLSKNKPDFIQNLSLNISNSLIKKESLIKITELEKAMESFAQDLDSHMNSQMQTPKNDNNLLLVSNNQINITSISEIDSSPKEVDELNRPKKKKTHTGMTIISPVKLMSGIKRFHNQIIENKKKLEAKSDFNQLTYTPFYFTRFFAGKLRKWKVKFCKFKGKDQDRRIMFSLQTKHWNYDFECPLIKDTKSKAFRDYRTIWPVVFQAFFDWMVINNFLTDEDFKNEHKYMSEKLKAKLSFYDWNQTAKHNLSALTSVDVKSCGDIKILIEILLGNYFVLNLKVIGETLKFIGLDMKESVINSYGHILYDLKKMRQELKRMKFMGIYYERKREKQLYEDFRKKNGATKYSKLYSDEFLDLMKIKYSNPKLQEIIRRDLDAQSNLLKKYKNLKISYHKELILLLHRKLNARYMITQFVKKDPIANLFCIVLVSVSGVLSKNSENLEKNHSSFENALDLTFVIKVFNLKYQQAHVNQETLGVRNFEKQLQMKINIKKLIKSIFYTGRLSKPMKKILKESLFNDLHIRDSKIILRHRGDISSINEQEFFQQNVEKKFNNINKNAINFSKRKAEINDPINEMFENIFVEIYNKDFIQKREENFDNFYENELNKDNFIEEEIQDLKPKPKYPAKYGHLEIIQEEDVEFIQNTKQEMQVSSQIFESSEKENLVFPSLESLNTTHYLKIRDPNDNQQLLLIRIIIMSVYTETSLHVSVYAPSHRIISYGVIDDKKLIIIIMHILNLKSVRLRQLKLSNILQLQSGIHGFKYMFVNKKKEKEFGISKKTLIFSSEISIKSHLIKNSEDLNSKFQHKTLHFLIKLRKIGKANVTMNVYFCDNLIEAFQENSILICFQINYYNSRTKALKLIMNRDDLIEVFKSDLSKVMTTGIFLTKIRELLQRISFVRQTLYASPHYIPKFSTKSLDSKRIQNVNKNNGKKESLDIECLRWYKNNFSKHELGKTQTNVTKSFLEQYIQDTRIIGQFIKKIKSDFVLITVSKHMILDYWVLYNYIPKTSRYFVCYITNSDLLYMDIKDLAKIYPVQMYNECFCNATKRAFVDYRSFYKKYKDGVVVSEENLSNIERKTSFQLNQLAQYQTEDLSNENQQKEIGHIVDSFKNKKMRKVMKIKTITDLTEKMNVGVRKCLTHIRYHNLYNYIEFFIWENFIKKLELKSLDDSSWFFSIKKFKVQLKQVLFSNYVKIDKHNDAYIEIFILLNKDKETLFSPFEPIDYAATSNHNILIRYLSLNKLSIQFEKINLREIINLFIADGYYKFQTNYMNSKFYLSDLQNLCNFIIYKIKSSNFANLIHDNSSKKKHHASKNTQYFKKMVENEDGSDAPVVQEIFNRKPLQIITFRFYLEEKILSAVIYKKSSCQCITREYKFDALKDVILFFDEMVNSCLYKEICTRLLKVIKNILSIDVNFEFMLLDKNDE